MAPNLDGRWIRMCQDAAGTARFLTHDGQWTAAWEPGCLFASPREAQDAAPWHQGGEVVPAAMAALYAAPPWTPSREPLLAHA